jgi:hypothetical protein
LSYDGRESAKRALQPNRKKDGEMAEETPLLNMLAALKKELALAQAISGGPAGHEPAYRSLPTHRANW